MEEFNVANSNVSPEDCLKNFVDNSDKTFQPAMRRIVGKEVPLSKRPNKGAVLVAHKMFVEQRNTVEAAKFFNEYITTIIFPELFQAKMNGVYMKKQFADFLIDCLNLIKKIGDANGKGEGFCTLTTSTITNLLTKW